MKISTPFVFAVIYVCGFQLPVAVSKLLLKVLLNKGKLPSKEGYTCTPNDSMLIQNAIAYNDNDRRSLKTKAQCKDDCAGIAAGSCHVTGCKASRRELRASRKLDDDDKVCADGIEELNGRLDLLLPKLSEACRPLVEFQRDVTCFDDVRYAQVIGFSLWNADTDTIVATNFTNGMTFCYTSSRLNIEALANACVREVEMKLSGPISEWEDSEVAAPYTLFGFAYNNRTNLYGRTFPVGKYTLSTEIDDSNTPKASITFSVKKCS